LLVGQNPAHLSNVRTNAPSFSSKIVAREQASLSEFDLAAIESHAIAARRRAFVVVELVVRIYVASVQHAKCQWDR
jgi:hypothetical protein